MTFPRFVPADEQPEIRKRIEEIAEAAIAGRVAFLLGAGFSKDAASLPLASELASRILVETYNVSQTEADRLAEKYELGAVAERYVERSTERYGGLTEILRKALNPQSGRAHSQCEQDLSAVASIARLKRIFTTNYDCVIEDALGPRCIRVGSTVGAIRDCEKRLAEGDVTAVYHLYGDLADPKVTEEDLRSHYTLHFEELRHQLCSSVLVMVGYSFRDDALIKVFDEMRRLLQATRDDRVTYLVTPIDSRAEYALAAGLWDARGRIRLLPLCAGQFMNLLRQSLEQVRTKAAVRMLAEKLSLPEDEVGQKVYPLLQKYAFYSAESIVNDVLAVQELSDTWQV